MFSKAKVLFGMIQYRAQYDEYDLLMNNSASYLNEKFGKGHQRL
jgi:hypothetical protein